MTEVIMTLMSIIITPLMGLLVWQLQRMIKTKSHDSEGIKILLRSVMREYHDKYLERGSITSDELAEYRELYDAYHNLKGNGKGTVWKEDVEKLERKGD